MIKPRKAVMGMQGYNPPISSRGGYLRLDFNENTLGCSKKAIGALKSIKPNYLATYPEYGKLRESLASYCNVYASEVLPTNGTDEAIKTIIEAYIEKGKDEIIIPVPTFPMYKFYAQLNEAVIKEISYNGDLSFPTKQVLGAINRKTKIVVIVSPNNPTGTSVSRNDIVKILRKAKINKSLVLIDEAYYQFYGKTSAPLIKKYDNFIVTQTFSKAFGLAGLRLGYAIANQDNIKIMQKVLSPYSVNNVAAACAMAALNDLDYVKKYVKKVNESKNKLYKALDFFGISYYKSDANFILLKIGKKANYFCQKLKEDGILVRNRSNDPLLEGCVRVTLGEKRQTERLIKAISSGLAKDINPLLIFDMDGVLVDVSKSYRAAVKETVKYFTGRSINFEEIQEYKNKGGLNNDWDLTEAIIRGRGISIGKKEIIKRFQYCYKKLAPNEKWLEKKLLKILSIRYNLAILTGRPRKEAYSALRKNGMLAYFKTIITMEDLSRQKPAPDGLLKITSKYSSDAYYFGDSVDDMKSAVAAKVNPIGVLPPQDKSSLLKILLMKNGAKSVINGIGSIMEVLR